LEYTVIDPAIFRAIGFSKIEGQNVIDGEDGCFIRSYMKVV